MLIYQRVSWDITGLYDVEWLKKRDHCGTIMGWRIYMMSGLVRLNPKLIV